MVQGNSYHSAIGSPKRVKPSEVGSSPELLRRVGQGAIWVAGGRALGIGVNVITSALLARLLAPADFGKFLVLFNLLAFAASMAMLGLGTAVVRFVPENLGAGDIGRAQRATALIWQVAVVSMLAVGLGTFLALWLGGARQLQLDTSTGFCLLAAIATVLLAGQQLAGESLRGYHELRFTSFLSGGQAGSPLAGALFLALVFVVANWRSPNLHWAVACLVAGLCVSVPLTLALLVGTVRRGAAGAVSKPIENSEARVAPPLSLSRLLSVSLPMLALQLLAFATVWADLWIASAFCSRDELAWYAAARRLIVVVWLPLQVVTLTVLSSIAGLYASGRKDELQQMLRGAAGLAALPAGLAAIAMIAAPEAILGLYYGPFYRQAALPLAILACGQLVVLACGLGGYTLLMTGRHYAALFVNLATAVFVLTAAPFAAWKFGIVGLSVVSATAAILQAGCEWLLARRLLGIWTHAGLSPAYTSLIKMFWPTTGRQTDG